MTIATCPLCDKPAPSYVRTADGSNLACKKCAKTTLETVVDVLSEMDPK